MRHVARVLLVAVLVAGCANGPILANPPAPRPSIPPPQEVPAPVQDPVPVVLPRDDAPHDRLTEWWYYTGHLVGHQSDVGLVQDPYSLPGPRYGFEFVVFRAERGGFPTTWASHFALTDETDGRFHYAQRLEVGEAVDRSALTTDGTDQGFDFELTGVDPTRPAILDRPPWKMTGWNGSDRLPRDPLAR